MALSDTEADFWQAIGVTSSQFEPHSHARGPMVDLVEHLLRGVEAAQLVLDTEDAPASREQRDRLAAQIRHHLLPRLKEVSAPVIVVLGGSTGAGKSTLVNSMIGSEVTKTGVLRPTTKEPLLAVHPQDAELLMGHPVQELATMRTHMNVPRGVAILDAPDLDSVQASNRQLAEELIELADLWVFVTTGSRYGDAVPWQRLQMARERGNSLAVVLNRVDSDAKMQVRKDLFTRLAEHGFGSIPFFVVPDVGPHEGMLAPELVAEFRTWVETVAASAQSRAVIARTVRGAWPALRKDVGDLAVALDSQRRAKVGLAGQSQNAVRQVAAQMKTDIAQGAPGFGAPTTMWLTQASSGGVLAAVAAKPAGMLERSRAKRRAEDRNRALQELAGSVRNALQGIIADACVRAERTIRDLNDRTPPGKQLNIMTAASTCRDQREERLESLINDWQRLVQDLTEDFRPGADEATLERSGVVALFEGAALGIEGLVRAVERIFPSSGSAVVQKLREDVATWAQVAVAGEAEPFVRALEVMGIDELAAATSLRLRASELKGV